MGGKQNLNTVKSELTHLFVYYNRPMKKSLAVALHVIETLQFLTIPISVDTSLPVDFENLGSVWKFINYVSRPDALLVSLGVDRIIITSIFLLLL
jgi:hypothetical protein